MISTTAPGPRRISATPTFFSFDRPLQWLLAVLAAVLVVGPLIPIVLQSLQSKPLYEPDRALTLGNFVRVLGSAELWGIVGTTLLFGVATTLISTVLGTAFAVLLGRTDL